jgi:hypothetical protein
MFIKARENGPDVMKYLNNAQCQSFFRFHYIFLVFSGGTLVLSATFCTKRKASTRPTEHKMSSNSCRQRIDQRRTARSSESAAVEAAVASFLVPVLSKLVAHLNIIYLSTFLSLSLSLYAVSF